MKSPMLQDMKRSILSHPPRRRAFTKGRAFAGFRLGLLCALAATGSVAAESCIRWLGSQRYMHGVNVPWISYAADFGTVEEWGNWNAYNHDTVSSMFAALNGAGVNSVRWWVFGDGRGAPEFSSTNGGAVTGLDASVLRSMDDAIVLASQYDIYITFCLWDFAMLDNDSTPAGKGEHAGGHRNIITNTAACSSFITNALLPMLRHQVTNTSYTIGTHPNVMAWDIINEPEWGVTGATSSVNQPVALGEMRRFIARTAGVIHSNANQLVTVGSACLKWNCSHAYGASGNWWSDAALTAYDAAGALDFYQIHYYGWMNGDAYWSYSPLHPSNSFSSAGFDKPTIVGEYPGSATGTGKTVSELVSGIRQNGYGGAWSWSYFGEDGIGAWADVAAACAVFASNHTGEITILPGHDADGDLVPDLQEFIAGTSATDPLDNLTVAIREANGRIAIGYEARQAQGVGYGGSSRYYGLDCRSSLATGSWQSVTGFERVAATNGPVECVVDPPMAGSEFYRLRTWIESK